MNISEIPIKVLGISGSPRKQGNTEIMLENALEGARSVGEVETIMYSLAGKNFNGCIFCNRCKETGRCCLKDDFNELFDLWLEADGLLYATPIFHMMVTSQLKAFIDRLGHVLFAYFNRTVPRFSKAGGVLSQGTAPYGGQEIALQYLVMHLMTVNCIPVSGDTPGSYVGAAGISKTWERGSIKDCPEALETAYNVGQKVAEMAKVIKVGKEAIENMPIEYDYISVKERGDRS